MLGILQAHGGSIATITSPLGRKADAASVSVALSTEDVALLNPLTAVVSGTVTASGVVGAEAVAGAVFKSDGTALTVSRASITASSSGATTIVSATAAQQIIVLQWALVCNAAVNVKWQSHVTPTDITGLHYFAANGGISSPWNPLGYFATVAGEALDINLSGNVAVGGSLVYVKI